MLRLPQPEYVALQAVSTPSDCFICLLPLSVPSICSFLAPQKDSPQGCSLSYALLAILLYNLVKLCRVCHIE